MKQKLNEIRDKHCDKFAMTEEQAVSFKVGFDNCSANILPLLLEAMEALELIKRPTPDRYKEVALGWRIEKTLETLTSINEKLEKM